MSQQNGLPNSLCGEHFFPQSREVIAGSNWAYNSWKSILDGVDTSERIPQNQAVKKIGLSGICRGWKYLVCLPCSGRKTLLHIPLATDTPKDSLNDFNLRVFESEIRLHSEPVQVDHPPYKEDRPPAIDKDDEHHGPKVVGCTLVTTCPIPKR